MSQSLQVMVRTMYGRRYGSAPCVVSLGGTPVEGHAVVCDDERWVSTREDCRDWLARHGLSMEEAGLLIDLSEASLQVRQSEESDEHQKELYLEEVGKIADGLLESVGEGKIANHGDLEAAAAQAVSNSAYVNRIELVMVAIRHSDELPMLRGLARVGMLTMLMRQLKKSPKARRLDG